METVAPMCNGDTEASAFSLLEAAQVCGLIRATGRGPPSLQPGPCKLEHRSANPEQSGRYQERMPMPGETSSQLDMSLQMAHGTHCTFQDLQDRVHGPCPAQRPNITLRHPEVKVDIY